MLAVLMLSSASPALAAAEQQRIVVYVSAAIAGVLVAGLISLARVSRRREMVRQAVRRAVKGPRA
jgi:uncharacterized integral membrane protein